MLSPFLTPHPTAQDNQLALVHLRRDLCIPTVLNSNASAGAETGYAEGVVTNTRFGSFPHSTLIGLPWGSQVRASQVDTGSRGRKRTDQLAGKKRKADALAPEDDADEDFGSNRDSKLKTAVTASSGFIHLLPPTPENWTTSLPHRTQVVYTPDYSYILHRLRARPGSIVIEAGSGSGSFTHAAARAVFNGYLDVSESGESTQLKHRTKLGKVYSYEFHPERYKKVREEMKVHGLIETVHPEQRDVYCDGFLISEDSAEVKQSPAANAVFLDLPAPWQALPHLTRQASQEEPSPLDPEKAVHICTFSPCIEQAQKTVSALRKHGWLEVEMVEMQHMRIDVRREYTGLAYEGIRGVNAIASDVEEALSRLREVEKRAREFHTGERAQANGKPQSAKSVPPGKPQEASKTLFMEGRLIHRIEPETKNHTSYLVFAVLPREWTDEDEKQARDIWKGNVTAASEVPKSQRQLKREARQKPNVKDKAAKGKAPAAANGATRDEDIVKEGDMDSVDIPEIESGMS